MATYIIRRILLLIPTLFLVTLILFVAMRVTPGDAVEALFLDTPTVVTEEDLQRIREYYGLDKPLPMQYLLWTGGFFVGDFGRSIQWNRDVSVLIKQRFPNSVRLGLMALTISLLFSIPTGIISAVRADKMPDYVGRGAAILALSLPGFWLATMIIAFPAVYLNWTPPLAYVPFSENGWDNIKIFFLPAVLLGIPLTGSVIRMTRAMMLEVLRADYIRTAHSKGLASRVVISRHALKNALIPVVTIVGAQTASVLSGTVIMETIFGLPGMGSLMRESIVLKDYPVVQSATVFLAMIVLTANLVVDISYGFLDPRIRYR